MQIETLTIMLEKTGKACHWRPSLEAFGEENHCLTFPP